MTPRRNRNGLTSSNSNLLYTISVALQQGNRVIKKIYPFCSKSELWKLFQPGAAAVSKDRGFLTPVSVISVKVTSWNTFGIS